jgi:hypothetical protein
MDAWQQTNKNHLIDDHIVSDGVTCTTHQNGDHNDEVMDGRMGGWVKEKEKASSLSFQWHRLKHQKEVISSHSMNYFMKANIQTTT